MQVCKNGMDTPHTTNCAWKAQAMRMGKGTAPLGSTVSVRTKCQCGATGSMPSHCRALAVRARVSALSGEGGANRGGQSMVDCRQTRMWTGIR